MPQEDVLIGPNLTKRAAKFIAKKIKHNPRNTAAYDSILRVHT
jgi:hypothetical protein